MGEFPFNVGDLIAVEDWPASLYVELTGIGDTLILARQPGDGDEYSFDKGENWRLWTGSDEESTVTFTTKLMVPQDGDRYVDDKGVIQIAYENWLKRPYHVITGKVEA